MEVLIITGVALLVGVLLRGGPPAEPRTIQITLDPEEPARRNGGTVLLLIFAIALMLLLFGGR